jgi:hypothetical protein
MNEPSYVLPLGQPIRFLAFSWDEQWEFDCPCVVLEPVVSYSSNGEDPEDLIKEIAEDLCALAAGGQALPCGLTCPDLEEFAWRGWNLEDIRAAAEAKLRGEKVARRYRFGEAVERWLTFQHVEEVGEVALTFTVSRSASGVV